VRGRIKEGPRVLRVLGENPSGDVVLEVFSLLSRTSIVEGGNKMVESLRVVWADRRGEVKLSTVNAPAKQSLNIVAYIVM